MHAIQQHVLRELTLNGPCRYAELKPRMLDGNKFVYHLRSLVRANLMSKRGDVYVLTAAGKRYAERMSLAEFKERIQPKIVTLIVIKDKRGSYVLYRRRRVPFRALVGFPNGKVHLGERIIDAARRELSEKTGLSASLSLRGHVYLTVHDEEELITHMLCHVFIGSNPEGVLRERVSAGDVFWGNPAVLPQKQLMPGVTQILKLVSSGKKNFFAEYFLDVHEEI